MRSWPSTCECQRRPHTVERHRSQHCAHSRGTLELVELVGDEPTHAVDGAELAFDRPCAQGDREQLSCKQQQAGRYARIGKDG